MTLEQLVVWRRWLPTGEPQRVGRDEAKARVAVRREQRTAWVRAALAGRKEHGAARTPWTAPRKSGADQRSIACELPPLPARREWSLGIQGSSSEHGSRTPERTPAPRSLNAGEPDLRAVRIELPAPRSPLDEPRLLREALAALSAQLERLERRVGRGAPLGP